MAAGRNMSGEVARYLHGAQEPSGRLQRGVSVAVELIGGCDHAGVTMASRRSVWNAAASDDVVREGDALQYALDEGPCLDTVRSHQTMVSQDLTADPRWPDWAPRAVAELGVNAMLSLLLRTERITIGALNLYADRPRAWDGDAITLAHAFADQLASAVADAREIEHRGRAMTSRTVIGQAQGIVMERYGLDADRAFDYVRRISQDTNRKLVAVAEEIVRTRRLPSGDPSAD